MNTHHQAPSPFRFFIWFDPLQPHRPSAVFYNNLHTLFRAQLPPSLTHHLRQRVVPRRAPSGSPKLLSDPPHSIVRFATTVRVHPLVVWNTAARLARRGSWEPPLADRMRFDRRVRELEVLLGPSLQPHIRACVAECLEEPALLPTRLSHCLAAKRDYLARTDMPNSLPFG
uniref:Neurovirulence factor ICP34.5 n=1 Tax=Macropodid alphaherpesvirus 1 TaxID=137443 RepID=Q91CH8_9ALPH|nr:ICP34.5 [Macropodid alphaherpesvirus 1]